MPTGPEIRQHLARYIEGHISLQEFERWFVPKTWDIHRANDPEAEQVSDEIEMNLSEYTDGVLNNEELRSNLTRVAGQFARQTEKTVVLS